MFSFKDFGRIALSGLGALVFTVTAVSAAVGPARAIETAPVAYAQHLVADQVRG